MIYFFQHRWLWSFGTAIATAFVCLLWTGELDVGVLSLSFFLATLVLSYPSFAERWWQSRFLPPDTTHVPLRQIREGNDVALLKLFELPEIYQPIKNRYALKAADASVPGLFLYIYLPYPAYEMRNTGPETIFRQLAMKLKRDLNDPQDLDFIAQRALPLALGFRLLSKNGFPYHELSRVIDVVKKDYFRENTRIRGVLQSKRRIFRMHLPEDNEWRTFQPYQEETVLLYGGSSLAHDFRSESSRKLPIEKATQIEAEKIEYPEKIPFGALLTYAKKGEISLQGNPEAVDKLYIDRVNVFVQGTEHRKEILQQLSRVIRRELGDEDLYPLFNYGQKLRGYLTSGRSLSDFVSSHGNFALYYDAERGWIVLKLEPRLELRLLEAYWGKEPKAVNGATPLTTSRSTLISGSPDSLLYFQINTGTPTRGQIFAADQIIESKIKMFAQIFGYQLLRPVGSGAEGCLYLAEKDSARFYLKSPDGQLAQEEINTIEALKRRKLIPSTIKTYAEDRMVVMPEFQPLPENLVEHFPAAAALLFQYLKAIWNSGYLCLDLTPDHVKMDPEQKMMFLIDFSGYTELTHFKKHPKELLADRKKIEYRTPEETIGDFRDPEKFQIYLIGLLLYQLSHKDHSLPTALQYLDQGSSEYERRFQDDFLTERGHLPLQHMLGFDPSQRKNFLELQQLFSVPPEQIRAFWGQMKS